MQGGIAERLGVADAVLEPVHAAHRVQRHDRQRQQARDDHEELEHLVVDRRRQAAEGDVDQHDRGRHQDGDRHRPAQHQVDDQREREQVDAGDQDRRHRERGRVEGVRRLAKAQAQVLGHGADLRPVVEGHHHEAQEDHGRNRAEPVVVHGRRAVLGAVRRLAEDLQRAQVRGDEGEARDPRRQRTARQEEVDVGLDRQPGDEPDAEHDREVDGEDRVVDAAQVEPQHTVPLPEISSA